MKAHILAIGKLRGPESELCEDYLKRLQGAVTVKEMTASKSLAPERVQDAEAKLLLDAIPQGSFTILLDERGKDLSSRELTDKLASWGLQADGTATFLIGGADGVTETVRQRAQATLAFGRATWPHRLVRLMLIEQLYRARQIAAGHPYHRD
ncbi:MAG: 23S rRNA (pseudouridine(1915)-N(3))-methyltransferase RlmH [Bdellovibrionales bacterium]